ncbi:MAG: MFS transporter [Thermoflexales bacterium]|nr:MFS transporter [Thermoflexales bacterium]
MEQPDPEPRILNRNFLLYMGGWAVTAFAYFGILGVLFNLFLLRLGFGAEFIGVLTGSGQLAWALCALPAGLFVRRFGLRIGLMTGALAQAVSITAMLSVEALPRELWPAWLFGWWIVTWMGAAPLAVSGAPLLMQVSPTHRRRETFTIQAVMLGIVAFAGSLIAGQLPTWFAPMLNASLDQPAPYRAALYLVPISYALALPIWARLKLTPIAIPASSESHDRQPTRLLAILAVMVFLQTAAEGALRAFFNVYLDQQLLTPVSLIGLIGAFAQVISVATALSIPVVLRRAGNANTLGAVTFGIAVCMTVMALVPTLAVAAISYVLAISLIGIAAQARQLFSQELVAPHWRTTVSSVNNVGVGLGWSSAAGLGGVVVGAAGFAGVFGIGAALSLAAAISMAAFTIVRGRASS